MLIISYYKLIKHSDVKMKKKGWNEFEIALMVTKAIWFALCKKNVKSHKKSVER